MQFGDLIIRDDGIAHFPELTGVAHGFTTRAFGNVGKFVWEDKEKVEARRNRAQTFITPRATATPVWLICQHGNDYTYVRGGEEKIAVDAAITEKQLLPLNVTLGDCTAIIITNEVRSVLALVHAGRGGTEGSIVSRVLRELAKKHDGPFAAAIGPTIRPCHYDRFDGDLVEANRTQLLAGGVAAEDILLADLCTYCTVNTNGERLFASHRYADEHRLSDERIMASALLL